VFRFDPLAGVEPPAGAAAGSFAGIAGLLHLHGRGNALPINFVHPREPKPPADPNRRMLTWAGIAAGILVLLGGATGYALVASKQKEVDALLKQQAEFDAELSKLDMDRRRIAAVDQWQKSSIVWLDELYNLTSRFPDVNRVRLTELIAQPLPLPPPQPGRSIDPDKPVAEVKLKGVTTDDNALSALGRELVRDVARVAPPTKKGNNTGGRRQARVEWGYTYQLAQQDKDQITSRKALTVSPPARGRNRGGPDLGGFPDMFNLGGQP
ncbi:MAG TPA: hypothetical protein VH120_21835, partial [Gemmataceae bacterium]|jgi:hypothetical protein|nr:hypothetical protein [Gemmataceae bacterium]